MLTYCQLINLEKNKRNAHVFIHENICTKHILKISSKILNIEIGAYICKGWRCSKLIDKI